MSSYSSTYPSIRPSFQFNADAGRLDPRITFSRSDTPPTYAAPSAVHYWSNEKHLSSENLITHSNAFTGTATVRVSNTTGQADPSGGTDAVQMSQQAGQTVAGGVYWAYTLEVGQEYTWSVYVKNDGRTFPQLAENFGSGGALRRTWFDTSSTGAAATTDAGHTALITKFGDWFRITIRFTPIVASGNVYFYISSADNSSVVADDGNGFIAYSASLSTTGQLVHENTSGQIARNYAPTLKSVSYAGQPRFEFSPTDSASMGLLIEGQSTNLLKESTDFSGSWQIINATKSLEAIAPNGALNAIAFREGTNSDQKRLLRYFDNAGPNLTISIYAKLLGNTRRLVIREANATGATAWFDLVSVTASSSGVIQSVGGGWYRCSLSIASSSTPMAAGFYIVPADGTLYTDSQFAGDGYSGLLLAMPQAEQQSFASSWISTTTATATRAADSAAVAVSDLGLTSGQDVSIITEANWGDPTNNPYGRFALALATDGNNRIAFYNNNGQNGSGWVRYGGSDSAFFNPGTTSGGYAKLGISAAMNSFNYAFNGTAATEDTAGVVPAYNELEIGSNGIGTQQLDGHVKRVAVYGRSLSSTELAAVTS